MTSQMRATIQQASKQYVQEQAQHLGGRVTKQALNDAAKTVSKVLERLAAARLNLKK